MVEGCGRLADWLTAPLHLRGGQGPPRTDKGPTIYLHCSQVHCTSEPIHPQNFAENFFAKSIEQKTGENSIEQIEKKERL
jgi:hypothetical protein